MKISEQNDLIRSVCGSSDRDFDRGFCEYYKKTNKECQLLRQDRMEEFWAKCRYNPFQKLYETINIHLRKFRQKYQNLPIDNTEDIDFQGIVIRLKKLKLKTGFTLVSWCNYMHKTVYMEIKSVLVGRGLIPKEVRCGACKSLTESKPYICLKKDENRKKGDEVCELYSQRTERFISVNSIEDEPGKENFILEMTEAKNNGIITPETMLAEKDKDNQIIFIREKLKKQIKDAKAGSQYRKKCERQYDIFINLLNLFSKEISQEKAFKILAKKNGLNIKTIQRDISEIRNFLTKNVS